MRTPLQLAQDYIEVWNERDAGRRRGLFRSGWSADAHYADPLMNGAGIDEIDDLIASVQGRFDGFRFALLGAPDGFGDWARFSWSLGPADGAPVVKGTDFVTRDGDRIARVVGFVDQAPAAG